MAVLNGLTAAARTALDLTNTAVIGHLSSGALYLDAASLAALWINLTLASLGRACDGALSVLTAQAYGAANYHLVGTLLLTGLFAFTGAAAILAGLWAVAPWLLGALLLGTPSGADVVSLAARYCRLAIPSALPSMWMWALACWLVAQRIAWPELVTYVAAVGVNLLLNSALVYWAGLGFDGAPLATVATRSLNCAVLGGIAALLHRRGALRLPWGIRWGRRALRLDCAPSSSRRRRSSSLQCCRRLASQRWRRWRAA